MTTAPSVVRLAPGPATGVVAASGVALVLDSPDSSVVAAIVKGFADGSSVEQLMTVLSAVGFEQLPAFAIVVTSSSGDRVIHRGAVVVRARAAGRADVVLHHARITTWREEVLTDIDEFEVSLEGDTPSADYCFNVGVVPAAKLIWTPPYRDHIDTSVGGPVTPAPSSAARTASVDSRPIADEARSALQRTGESASYEVVIADDMRSNLAAPLEPLPESVVAHDPAVDSLSRQALRAPVSYESGEADDPDPANLIDHTVLRHIEHAAARHADNVEAPPLTPAAAVTQHDAPCATASGETILRDRTGCIDSNSIIDEIPGSGSSATNSLALGEADPDHDGRTVARPSGRRSATPPASGITTATHLLQVVTCTHQHPNPPSAHACRVCGQPIRDRAMTLVPRPSLGTLQFSTGSQAALLGPVLVGRNPPSGQMVDGEPAQVVAIDNSELSRFHVAVHISEWFVHVADQGSTNGTVVRTPGKPPMTLRPYERVQIAPETVIDLGGAVTFTYTTK